MWPEAATDMQRQRAHSWIVSVIATRIDRIKMWMAMTRAVAAMAGPAAALVVVGIYWPTGGLVHAATFPNARLGNLARPAAALSLDQFSPGGRNPDGTLFGFTTGLAAFEHMELEVLGCDWTPETLVDRRTESPITSSTTGPSCSMGKRSACRPRNRSRSSIARRCAVTAAR